MDQIREIGEYLARLVEGPFKTAGAFLASLVVLYWDAAPQALRGAVVAAGVLFVCDIILGMTRALAERRFSSLGFGRAITKFVAYAGDQTQYGYVRIGTYYASHLLILETKPHTPLELMLIFRLPVTRSVV